MSVTKRCVVKYMFNEIEKYRLANNLSWVKLSEQLRNVTYAYIPANTLRHIILKGKSCRIGTHLILVQFAAHVSKQNFSK